MFNSCMTLYYLCEYALVCMYKHIHLCKYMNNILQLISSPFLSCLVTSFDQYHAAEWTLYTFQV